MRNSGYASFEEPYHSLEQQRETSTAGMWLFLGTEVMFFGGLFAAYAIYRWLYPEVFRALSQHLDVASGTLNTAILLTSSFTMALAVKRARELPPEHSRKISLYLLATQLLGIAFLAVKAKEWVDDYHHGLFPGHWTFRGPTDPASELFFFVYYSMVGLHGIHVLIGVALVGWFAVLSLRRRFSKDHYMPIEVLGLYWHYVDLVWIFLYPLFYLVDPR